MTQFKAGDKVTPVVAERYAIPAIELMKQLVGKPLLVHSVHSYKNGDVMVLAGVPGKEGWFWLADDLRLVTAWSNEPIQDEPTKTAAQNPAREGETNRVDSTCEKDQAVEVKVQSASKHTPGPWKAHFDETYFVTGIDGGRVAIATQLKGPYGIGGRRSAEESAANCRLIASAPDLLKQRDELLEAVQYAAAVFAEYVTLHKAKGDAGAEKAQSNQRHLQVMLDAVAKARGES